MKNSWEILGDFQVSSVHKFMTIPFREKNPLSELAKISEEFSSWVLWVKHILMQRMILKTYVIPPYA